MCCTFFAFILLYSNKCHYSCSYMDSSVYAEFLTVEIFQEIDKIFIPLVHGLTWFLLGSANEFPTLFVTSSGELQQHGSKLITALNLMVLRSTPDVHVYVSHVADHIDLSSSMLENDYSPVISPASRQLESFP